MNLYKEKKKKKKITEYRKTMWNQYLVKKRSIGRFDDVIVNRKILFILTDIDKECTRENRLELISRVIKML